MQLFQILKKSEKMVGKTVLCSVLPFLDNDLRINQAACFESDLITKQGKDSVSMTKESCIYPFINH